MLPNNVQTMMHRSIYSSESIFLDKKHNSNQHVNFTE